MRIVPLDRLLLSELVAHERDPLVAEMASGPLYADMAMLSASLGNAFAMIDGAHVVAGAGLTLRWQGRVEAWALVTTFARPRHLAALVREGRSLMARRQRDPAYRRIEAFVRDGAQWCAKDFARALGFTVEGWLRAWDPAGRDYLICARIAPEIT